MNAPAKKTEAAPTPEDATCAVRSADEPRVRDEPAARLWPDGWILLLHIALPIAITGAIVGRKAIFARLRSHLEKLPSFVAVFCPSFSKRAKLTRWMTEYLPNADGGLAAMWRDGALMCTLINSVVPGACPNPHRHWRKPPTHGQALAYKYLGVAPVFSEADLLQSAKPSAAQEKRLVDYVCSLQAAVERMTPHARAHASYSTRYVARGMGLVAGEQHRRTDVYVYPNFQGQTHDDLLVHVRGPYNTYGSATLKAVAFSREQHAKPPDKRQSFLKSLSADFSSLLKPKERGPARAIRIRTDFERDRAKLTFVPDSSGVYEICLTTNGEHIAGSPFTLSVEKNRSGVTQRLSDDEEVKVRLEPKSAKRKVVSTVIRYEKLRSNAPESGGGAEARGAEEARQIPLQDVSSTDAAMKADGEPSKVEHAVGEREDEFAAPILETLEQLNNLLERTESIEAIAKLDAPKAPRGNFGLRIIDTMRSIPDWKLTDKPAAEGVAINHESARGQSHGQLAENNENGATHNQDCHLYNALPLILENERNVAQNCDVGATSDDIYQNPASLEDSGAFVHDDIDPDSLSSSVETPGSIEEMSFSGGSASSESNEVNNNDIMVMSNEDICYVIANRGATDRHKRVYSKDFVRYRDAQSKDDLSKSDPNLQQASSSSSNSSSKLGSGPNGLALGDAMHASALSQDNVQEAHEAATSSRLFQKHPQEAQRIAGIRSYSYSQGSLLERADSARKEGLEFKQHFLMRKAFWTNMSQSNVDLAGSSDSGRRNATTARGISRNLMNSESARSPELRSRSLDYVRQRRKVETPAKEAGFGSTDELNFPSVRHRRQMLLKERKGPVLTSAESKPELYAVRGEKYSWSIHEKIKSFEVGSTPGASPASNSVAVKLQTLPENNTIATKIKQRFESAQTYFKRLESGNGTSHQRRHSLDGQGAPLAVQAIKARKPHVNTMTGMHSLDNAAVGADNELQHFFNERRKRKQHARTPAVDVFK